MCPASIIRSDHDGTFEVFFHLSSSSCSILLSLIIQELICVICVLPCHRRIGLFLWKGGHGIFKFNVRSDLFVHTLNGQTVAGESAQVLTRKNRSFTLMVILLYLYSIGY